MDHTPQDQKSVFRGPDRAEKGSALTLIAEEKRLRTDKTERLKQLRLARDEALPAPEPKAKPKAKAKPRPKAAKKSKTAA